MQTLIKIYFPQSHLHRIALALSTLERLRRGKGEDKKKEREEKKKEKDIEKDIVTNLDIKYAELQ